MLSNIISKNRVKTTPNRELGRSSQEHHNSETDHYPPITYQLNNLNNSLNIRLRALKAAYGGIYQLHKLDMHCYFKSF